MTVEKFLGKHLQFEAGVDLDTFNFLLVTIIV